MAFLDDLKPQDNRTRGPRQRAPVTITGEKPKSWLEQKMALASLGMTDADATGQPQRSTPGEVAEELLYFTPVVGDAMSGRDAYREGRQGNYGRAALSLLGAIPLIGTVGDVAKGVERAAGKEVVEQAASSLGTRAAEQRIAKLAANDALESVGSVPLADPTGFLRQAGIGSAARARNEASREAGNSLEHLFDGKTAAEATEMAKQNLHLRQTPDGQFVGAPEGTTSMATINKLRRDAASSVEAGVWNAPWYTRARESISEVSGYDPAVHAATSPEGRKASTLARSGAAYSPQAAPSVETNAALRQHYAKVLEGKTDRPRTGEQSRNVNRAYVPDPATGGYTLEPDNITQGYKTGNYANAKDPTIPDDLLFRTANDIWHGRVMGFKGEHGKPFDRGFTGAEHGYLTGENLQLVEEAKRRGWKPEGAPASFEWNPRSAQAATWGAERFKSFKAEQDALTAKFDKEMGKYNTAIAKGKKAKRPTAPVIETDDALRARASTGIDDAINTHVAAITGEHAPGAGTRVMAGFEDLPPEVQAEHIRKAQEAGGPRNDIWDALQGYQKPVITAEGSWVDPVTGAVSHSTADVARPIVSTTKSFLGKTMGLESAKEAGLKSMKTPEGRIHQQGPRRMVEKDVTGGQQLSSPERAGLDLTAAIEAVLRGQQGVGWNVQTPANSSMRVAEQTGTHVAGLPAHQALAKDALAGQGLDVIDVGDGLNAGYFSPSTVKGQDVQRKVRQALEGGVPLPGLTQAPGRLETGLQMPPHGAEGQGSVTAWLLDKLENGGVKNAAQRLDAGGVPERAGKQFDLMRDLEATQGVVTGDDWKKFQAILGQPGGFQSLQTYVKKHGLQGLPAAALTTGGAGYLASQQDGR